MNEHIINVPDGNKTEAAVVDMSGFTFSSGGSGHVPPGNYQVKCTEAKWSNKKNRGGKNLKIVWKVVAPRKYAGTQLVGNHPAPAGQAGDQSAEAGANFYKAVIATIADAGGKLNVFTDKGNIKIQPAWFEGKTGHLRAEDDHDDRGNLRSSIARYLPKKDFEESPGPDVSDDMGGADLMGDGGGAEPEIAAGSGGNGVGETASAPSQPAGDAVADMMDIPGL